MHVVGCHGTWATQLSTTAAAVTAQPTGALRRSRRPWRRTPHVFAGVFFAALAGQSSVGKTFEGVVVDAAPEVLRVLPLHVTRALLRSIGAAVGCLTSLRRRR